MKSISVTELNYQYLAGLCEGKVLDVGINNPVTEWLRLTLSVEKSTCYIAASRKLVFYPVLMGVEALEVHWTRRRELLNEMETFVFNEIVEVAMREELHTEMSTAKELLWGYTAFCARYGLSEDMLPFERVMRTYTNHRPEGWRRYTKTNNK
jgi:hypothetical protein